MLPYFENRKLADVRARHVKAFIKSLEAKGHSPAYVKLIQTPLRCLLADAAEDERIPFDPAASVRRTFKQDRDTRDAKVKVMDDEQLTAILAAVPERYRLMFYVLTGAGLRIGELLGLQWGDIEFGDAPSITVNRQWRKGTVQPFPKSDAGRRTVPIYPELAAALGQLWASAAPCARLAPRSDWSS